MQDGISTKKTGQNFSPFPIRLFSCHNREDNPPPTSIYAFEKKTIAELPKIFEKFLRWSFLFVNQ